MAIPFWRRKQKPELSVVVVFYNMRREAARTLKSLTGAYQRNAGGISYEVIAVDSGSSEPLDGDWVRSHGDNFRYVFFDSKHPSPCEALNHGARLASGNWLSICIDGARILSPGILGYSMMATRLHPSPYIYTLSMHIGRKVQNVLAEESYTREDEDRLLATVDWENNGYKLFEVSTPALSSKDGYFSKMTESNCITMARSTFERLGGFDESFRSSGGGLVNLDFFNRLNEAADLQPILLLGEATFHQFHGGTATNVPMKDHPFPKMAREYEEIRHRPFAPVRRRPIYFGSAHSGTYGLMGQPKDDWGEVG